MVLNWKREIGLIHQEEVRTLYGEQITIEQVVMLIYHTSRYEIAVYPTWSCIAELQLPDSRQIVTQGFFNPVGSRRASLEF